MNRARIVALALLAVACALPSFAQKPGFARPAALDPAAQQGLLLLQQLLSGVMQLQGRDSSAQPLAQATAAPTLFPRGPMARPANAPPLLRHAVGVRFYI